MIIRLYQSRDRSTVRNISCDTADRGRPVENFFHDREFTADVLMNYYTNYEPESLWVAEHGGRIVGYLTGCLDTNKYNRIIRKKILPKVILQAVQRGMFFYKDTWRLVIAALRTLTIGGFLRNIPINEYPAHLHINILQEFRGQRIGEQLMNKFFEQATQAGLSGIHLSTLADNVTGRKFFEKMGFTLISQHPAIMPNDKPFKKNYTVIYGKKL